VNFDVERARAAAEVLEEFGAQGHQLFVFTCHEHLAALFQDLDVPVRQLHSHSGGTVPLMPPAKKKPAPKRKRSPEPTPMIVIESVAEAILEEPMPVAEPIVEAPLPPLPIVEDVTPAESPRQAGEYDVAPPEFVAPPPAAL